MGQTKTWANPSQTVQGLWLFIRQPLFFKILSKWGIRRDIPGHRDVCRSVFISEVSCIFYIFVRRTEGQKG